MLAALANLKALVHHLIVEIDSWAAQKEKTACTLSSVAMQRLSSLRKKLRQLRALQEQLEDLVPETELEAMQQCPTFWLTVEGDIASLLSRDAEVNEIQIVLQKVTAEQKSVTKPGYLAYTVSLEGLLV